MTAYKNGSYTPLKLYFHKANPHLLETKLLNRSEDHIFHS